MTFEVLDGGLATTVQDGGRPDWTHLGVPRSGPCDPWSLAVANLLVGGEPEAAALEMTLVGPTLVARRSTIVGLAGADLGGRVGGRRLAPGRSHRIEAGETMEFPGDRSDRRARAYLALPGGIDVPEVLGSRSTCLAAGFGGIDGRPLRTGDVVGARVGLARAAAAATELPPGERVWPADPEGATNADGIAVLRVIAGPAPGCDAIAPTSWRVGREADRVGLRLDGGLLPAGIAGEAVSHGVPWGAVQVPPDGRPIVLGPDHQTTGGYPVVAVVIAADRPVLGQLRPGTEVRFEAIGRAEALMALQRQRAALIAGAAAVRESVGWDELVRSAGG